MKNYSRCFMNYWPDDWNGFMNDWPDDIDGWEGVIMIDDLPLP